jgi:hypothetical protein
MKFFSDKIEPTDAMRGDRGLPPFQRRPRATGTRFELFYRFKSIV